MWNNVPDDWWQYEKKCSRCGSNYHASEGGCYACYELSNEEVEELRANRLDWELEVKDDL